MKYALLLAMIILNSPFSFSQVKVINNLNGKIEITGKSCEVLQKNFEAIKEWKLKKNEPVYDTGNCTCSEDICKMDITKILPKDIKKREGSFTLTYGPNCFNTALFDLDILKDRRIVSTDELKFWVNSKLCQERDIDEALDPGDLVVISHGSDLPLHGFIYLSDDLVYSKGGPSKDAKYELTSYESMFNYYKVPKECWRKTGTPDKSECVKYANAYQCKSFDKLGFKSNNQELNELLEGLDQVGCEVNKKLFAETVGFSIGKELLESTIEAFRMTILDNRSNPKLSPEDKFLWDMAYYRFLSLRRQIDFF